MDGKIYTFGYGTNVGDASMKDLLGSKGANLAEMSNMDLPVPPGFTITTDVCRQYRALDAGDHRLQFIDEYYMNQIEPALNELIEHVGHCPLLSIRSGAADSMPGMMDTLLNIGMTTTNMGEWETRLGYVAAMDCRRRQFEMYASTVLDLDYAVADIKKLVAKSKYGLKEVPANIYDSVVHVEKLVGKYKQSIHMPNTLEEQVIRSIRAVFDSWDSERAIEYREMHGIDNELGTAVTIQQMVFGNLNAGSASGVYFTRDPATGERKPYGDFVTGGQGEDVVAGTHETLDLMDMKKWNVEALDALLVIGNELEAHYEDMVDTEFTIENGVLWMLQVRVGKREAKAAFRIAHDLYYENVITKQEAIEMVSADQYKALKKIRVDLEEIPTPDFVGIKAGGSLTVGRPVFSSAEAKELGPHEPVILVRDETTPEDFGGMAASVGILTRTGGTTSHAAVVGRSLEKHCVVGCLDLPQDLSHVPAITINGSTGEVWLQALPLIIGGKDEFAEIVLGWATEGAVLRIELDDDNVEGNCIILGDMRLDEMVSGMQALIEKSFSRVFIDVSIPGSEMRSEDSLLWNLTGEMANPALSELELRVTCLNGEITIKGLKGRAVLIAPPAAAQKLREGGWSVVSVVDSVETLLQSDGVVDVKPELIEQVGSSETAAALIATMIKAGKVIEAAPSPVSSNRLVSTVFK